MVGVRFFVASPCDQEELRGVFKTVVTRVACGHEAAVAYDYRDSFPERSITNPLVASSDVVVVILGSRVGKGTLREYRVAHRLLECGSLGRLVVYLSDPNPGSCVERFKVTLQADGVLHHDIGAEECPAELFRAHVSHWLEREKKVQAVVDRFRTRYQFRLDESILSCMRAHVESSEAESISSPPYARKVAERQLRIYQEGVPSKIVRLSAESFALIGRYLIDEIAEGSSEAFKSRQFIFPIHQQIARLVAGLGVAKRTRVTDQLREWLVDSSEGMAVVRDFSAFQLGMQACRSATTELLAAVSDPGEVFPVRNYGAMALGMLRSRELIPELAEVYDRSDSAELQKTIAHTILVSGS